MYKRQEKDKAAEELKALQYQINPHFLYNSLNSIRWMAMLTNNGKIADSIVMLTKIITPVFRNPSLTWKIRDELEFLDNYIGMMLLRYAGNLQYRMECGEDLYDEVFPRFVLQPVIENCFVHCRTKTDGMEIRVKMCIRDRCMGEYGIIGHGKKWENKGWENKIKSIC